MWEVHVVNSQSSPSSPISLSLPSFALPYILILVEEYTLALQTLSASFLSPPLLNLPRFCLSFRLIKGSAISRA